MAHMYPEDGPMKGTTSNAEMKVYEALRDQLDDEFMVFHGATWHSKEDDGYVADGEVDFIVVHRDLGLILLEVKGGSISYDGAGGKWLSRDRFAQVHEIADPFKQVSKSVHVLKRLLKRAPSTSPYGHEYRLSYGVWFTDIDWTPAKVSLPHVSDDLVLDRTNLRRPDDGLRRIAQHFAGAFGKGSQTSISEQGWKALEEMLAPSLAIKSTLAILMEGDERRIDRLSVEQFSRLDRLSRHRRLAICGAAGTGKTVLAIEKARRLAVQGLDVLLVCINNSLAKWIAGKVALDTADVQKHLRVHHLEELCLLLAHEAGQAFPVGNKLTQSELARLMSQYLATLKAHGRVVNFDAVLVDEAQDIDQPVWTQLNKLLRDIRDGIFYVFYDPAQRDGDSDWSPPSFVAKTDFRLTENCRNSQNIFRVVKRFYGGMDELICLGPEGSPVVCIDPATISTGTSNGDAEVAALVHVLDRLVKAENVRPEDILVITGRPQKKSRWYTQQNVGEHKLTWRADAMVPGRVALSTVRSAKGLERSVVVLTELDGLREELKRDALLYVALSRAIHHLVVLGPKNDLLPRQPNLFVSRPAV